LSLWCVYKKPAAENRVNLFRRPSPSRDCRCPAVQ